MTSDVRSLLNAGVLPVQDPAQVQDQVQAPAFEPPHPQAKRYPAPSERDQQLINRVFNRLKAHISAWKQTLTSAEVEKAAKQEWFKAFIDHGIHSDEQLQAGFAYLRSHTVTWWPSVAQFIDWCHQHGGLQLPSARNAYYEYCRHLGHLDQAQWSHPIVRVAGREAGSYDMANLPESQGLPLFERAYEVLKRRIQQGQEIDYPVPKALPEQVAVPLSRAENRARLSQLVASL